MSSEDILELVDKDDKVIGKATRGQCHKDPALLHRTAGTLVFNKKGELLMQKRSMTKDTNPGKWSISSWGHLDVGEGYERAAKRELREELGITAKIKVLFKSAYSDSRESEIFCIYGAKHDGPFNIDMEEIEKVEFMSMDELKKQLKEQPEKFTEGCHAVLAEYFRRFA